jgi:hypothetical protein
MAVAFSEWPRRSGTTLRAGLWLTVALLEELQLLCWQQGSWLLFSCLPEDFRLQQPPSPPVEQQHLPWQQQQESPVA